MFTYIKSRIRRGLFGLGYDVVRFAPTSHPLARRMRLMERFGVELVLDVGANSGQYASGLRRLGYRGRIISFEPLSQAFATLVQNSNRDPDWTVHRLALGDEAGEAEINIAKNSFSSSLLDMGAQHLHSAPQSRYVGRETILVDTLDSRFDELCQRGEAVYLKIDTQGFEKRVLDGAAKSLPRIDSIQLEMSLAPLYNGEASFRELLDYLDALGFELMALEPGFSDPESGRLLQVDGLFHRP